MGQAKNRGTYEERKEEAILRNEEMEIKQLTNPERKPRLPITLLAALSLISQR